MSEQLLKASSCCKSFGFKDVLRDVSLIINRSDRLALVGANGVGKTTLIKILIGQLEPDSGIIERKNGLQIGYLSQDLSNFQDEQQSLRQYFEDSLGNLHTIATRMAKLEAELANPAIDSKVMQQCLEEYGILQEVFEEKNGYDLDHRIERVMEGLELEHLDPDRQLSSLSGGERTRLHFAAMLLQSPDLLILDEPTNHLDTSALIWLEKFLSAYPNAFLVISHDRRFLNNTVQVIAELNTDPHLLSWYYGDYDDYLSEKQRRYEKALRDYEDYKNKVKELKCLIKAKSFSEKSGRPPSDNNWMAYDHKGGRVDKSKSRLIRNAKERLSVLEKNPISNPKPPPDIGLRFLPKELVSERIIQIEEMSKKYDNNILFSNVSKEVYARQRVIISGANGIGKSTLLKMIIGWITPDTGSITLAPCVQLGYLDQEGESLDLEKTILEEYAEGRQAEDSVLRAELHKYGLFGDQQVFMKVKDLSTGQRQKLQLAKIIGSGANVLLLDEPTNHLDFECLEALEQALLQFPGTVLAVSHDRTFIEKIATDIWLIKGQCIL